MTLTENEQSTKLLQTIVIAFILSVVGVIAIAASVLHGLYCKNVKNKKTAELWDSDTVALNLFGDATSSSGRFSSFQVTVTDPEYEVSYENIEFEEMLGEGAFGHVMLAMVHGLPKHPAPLMAAVKMLKGMKMPCV